MTTSTKLTAEEKREKNRERRRRRILELLEYRESKFKWRAELELCGGPARVGQHEWGDPNDYHDVYSEVEMTDE